MRRARLPLLSWVVPSHAAVPRPRRWPRCVRAAGVNRRHSHISLYRWGTPFVLGEGPTAVNIEAVARNPTVGQEELGRLNHVGNSRKLAARRTGRELLNGGRLLGPKITISNNAWVQRINADRCKLQRKRVDQSHDTGVNRRHSGRPWVGKVFCAPAEKNDPRVEGGIEWI